MTLLSFDFEYFVQVIKTKFENAGTVKSINNIQPDVNGNVTLSISNYTKLDFTTTSSWVAGGVGFKLTLSHSNGKRADVYHTLDNNKFEPVIVGIEIEPNNIIIESFEKFNGYVIVF